MNAIVYTVEQENPFNPSYDLVGVAATLAAVEVMLIEADEDKDKIDLPGWIEAFGKGNHFDTGNFLITRWQVRGGQ